MRVNRGRDLLQEIEGADAPDEDLEMRENGPWEVNDWGGGRLVLQSQDFHHDAALEISGDFGSLEIKRAYATEICRRLNMTNPVSTDAD